MGYGDHREARPEDARSVVVPAPESAAASVQSWLGVLGEVLSLGVRVVGVALLLAGLWVSLEVVQEALPRSCTHCDARHRDGTRHGHRRIAR